MSFQKIDLKIPRFDINNLDLCNLAFEFIISNVMNESEGLLVVDISFFEKEEMNLLHKKLMEMGRNYESMSNAPQRLHTDGYYVKNKFSYFFRNSP